MASRALLPRMWRAARLEADLYEEVEAEPASLRQAVGVVLLASAAGGAGVALANWMAGRPLFEIVTAVRLIEPWLVWVLGSAFAYMVGATFFRGPETETDYAEVLRTVGFSFGPGVLRVFAFVPVAYGALAIDVVAGLWQVAAAVVAVRQALDFTTARALGTFGAAYALLFLMLQGLLFLLRAV